MRAIVLCGYTGYRDLDGPRVLCRHTCWQCNSTLMYISLHCRTILYTTTQVSTLYSKVQVWYSTEHPYTVTLYTSVLASRCMWTLMYIVCTVIVYSHSAFKQGSVLQISCLLLLIPELVLKVSVVGKTQCEAAEVNFGVGLAPAWEGPSGNSLSPLLHVSHPTFLLLATESTSFNVTLEGHLWQGVMSDMTKPYQLLSFDGSEQRLLWTQQVGDCAADEVVFCSLKEIRSNSFWTPGSVVPIPVARSTSRSRTVMGTCKAWYWYESWHFCWRGHHLLWMSVIVHLVSCFIQSLLVVNSYGRDLCHTLYKVHIMWFWMQIFKIISNPVC